MHALFSLLASYYQCNWLPGKIISEMTYVSSSTLNLTKPNLCIVQVDVDMGILILVMISYLID